MKSTTDSTHGWLTCRKLWGSNMILSTLICQEDPDQSASSANENALATFTDYCPYWEPCWIQIYEHALMSWHVQTSIPAGDPPPVSWWIRHPSSRSSVSQLWLVCFIGQHRVAPNSSVSKQYKESYLKLKVRVCNNQDKYEIHGYFLHGKCFPVDYYIVLGFDFSEVGRPSSGSSVCLKFHSETFPGAWQCPHQRAAFQSSVLPSYFTPLRVALCWKSSSLVAMVRKSWHQLRFTRWKDEQEKRYGLTNHSQWESRNSSARESSDFTLTQRFLFEVWTLQTIFGCCSGAGK